MGRIKTKFTKRITHDLFRLHNSKFSGEFSENKKLVNEYSDISSKKMRNVIAGYLTRLAKNREVL